MIVADVTAAPSVPGGLPFNWFDVVVVCLLGFGLFRGRKNGISRELLLLLQWTAIVAAGGLLYARVGDLIGGYTHLDRMWSYIAAYAAMMVLLIIPFAFLRRKYTEQFAKKDVFKGTEYYLGMLGGMVRYACIVMVALAFLNAPTFTSKDIAEAIATDKKNFGGGEYQGNYFPHLFDIQDQVLNQSACGAFIARSPLAVLLIHVDTAPPTRQKPQPKISLGR